MGTERDPRGAQGRGPEPLAAGQVQQGRGTQVRCEQREGRSSSAQGCELGLLDGSREKLAALNPTPTLVGRRWAMHRSGKTCEDLAILPKL